ncbi:MULTISPECIES: hypothetical protein [unclassified Microcoleus]|uniref:hypothetical protein n=1 Tax=unclassified Microcoleus TaxID=2642155 RepID=UPI002FD305EF
MQNQPFPFLNEQVVERIFASGQLTREDRQRIQSMLLDESIGEHELSLVEKVMSGVVNGLLDVLN